MRGQVLDFSIQTNTGAISGADGNRYTFRGTDWKETRPPARGMRVDFTAEDSRARGIYLDIVTPSTTGKNKVTAGVLAILLGSLGIHKFYLGFTGPGLVFLLVNTVGWTVTWLLLGIPNIALGVIAFIEGIIYLTLTDEEFEQRYIIQKKQWF